MNLLILGGTAYLGRHAVEAALARGHEVTLFNRGRTNRELFREVERLHGDRDGDLSALEGGRWDAVIDPSGYLPRLVHDSCELLRDAVSHYVFISSISAYADPTKPGITEDDALAPLPDGAPEGSDRRDLRTLQGALRARGGERVPRALRDRARGTDLRSARPDGSLGLLADANRGRRRRTGPRASRACDSARGCPRPGRLAGARRGGSGERCVQRDRTP